MKKSDLECILSEIKNSNIQGATDMLEKVLGESSDYIGTYKMHVRMETQDYFKAILNKNDKLTTIKRIRDFLQDWINENIAVTSIKLESNSPIGPEFDECYGYFTFKTQSNFVKFYNYLVDNNNMIGKSFKAVDINLMISIPEPGLSMDDWESFYTQFNSKQAKQNEYIEQRIENRVGKIKK